MIPDDRLPRFSLKYSGPVHRRGIRCNRCGSMKEKEKRKLDSCPECGKSLFAFRK